MSAAPGVAAIRSQLFVPATRPAQATLVNTGLAPTTDEVDQAREVIRAFEAVECEGHGAGRRSGRMLDAPVVERARRLLLRQQLVPPGCG